MIDAVLFTDNVSEKAEKVGTEETLSFSAIPVGQAPWRELLKLCPFLKRFGKEVAKTVNFTDIDMHYKVYKVTLQSVLNKIYHIANTPHVDNCPSMSIDFA